MFNISIFATISTRHLFDIHTTSITLKRLRTDVLTTSCAYWVRYFSLYIFFVELSVGDLEITPVSAAIASYLGIDLSVEGKAARNRRGICIIVHGAPLSGKSATAQELSRRYRATLINIDEVVEQAITEGKTSAGRFSDKRKIKK